MKYKLFLIGLFALAMQVSAQNNIIKTGLPNIFYGEYQLGYERMLNEKQSIQFKAGFFQPVSSFLINKDLFRFTKEFTVKGVDGGYQTSLEYRFYMTGNQNPSGFYVAPYARLAQLYISYSDVVKNLDFNVAGRFSLVGAGAQMGYQWLIKDRFCIDFNFFGAGVDYWSPRLVYTREGYTTYSAIADDIRNAVKVDDNVEKFFNPTKRISTIVNDDNLTARLPFVLPGFRIGLSIGYAF